MEKTTRPLFALYIVWHPSNENGGKVADLLRRHFGRDRHRSIAGDPGLSVIYRSEIASGALVPLSIDWDEAETTAVVVLVDSTLAGDTAWSSYVRELSRNAQTRGLSARLFPVVMEPGGRELQLDEQALRWDRWEGSNADRERRLVSDLTCEFIRMLRHRLRGPEAAEAPLADYLEKIQVFISHSKHDNDGEPVARSIVIGCTIRVLCRVSMMSATSRLDCLSVRLYCIRSKPVPSWRCTRIPIRPVSGAVER